MIFLYSPEAKTVRIRNVGRISHGGTENTGKFHPEKPTARIDEEKAHGTETVPWLPN